MMRRRMIAEWPLVPCDTNLGMTMLLRIGIGDSKVTLPMIASLLFHLIARLQIFLVLQSHPSQVLLIAPKGNHFWGF